MFFTTDSIFSFFTNINDTSLHTAIRNCKNIVQIKEFILKYGNEHVSKMATTTNNKGELPIDLIEQTKLDKNNQNTLKNILMNLMLKNRQYKLPCQLQSNDVLNSITMPFNDIQRQLVINICNAVNDTHEIILESSTHPEANNYSNIKRKKISKTIHSNKELIKNEWFNLLSSKLFAYQLSLKWCRNTQPLDLDKLSNQLNDFVLKKAVEVACRTKKGNCEDFSLVTQHLLESKYNVNSSEVFTIKNGGHVFLVINRLRETDPSDFKTWNPETIFCDAQLGLIFTKDQMSLKLMDWRPYKTKNSSFNVLTSFNSNYQTLEPYSAIDSKHLALTDENEICKEKPEEKSSSFYAGLATYTSLALCITSSMLYAIYNYEDDSIEVVSSSMSL